MYDFKKKKQIEHARNRQQASRAISINTDTICRVCGEPLTVGNLTAVLSCNSDFYDICIKCKAKKENENSTK